MVLWKGLTFVGVFLRVADETAIQVQHLGRTHGWAPAGQQAPKVVEGAWGQRKSLLPAISTSGVLAMTIQDGSIKRVDFEAFLEDELVSIPFKTYSARDHTEP